MARQPGGDALPQWRVVAFLGATPSLIGGSAKDVLAPAATQGCRSGRAAWRTFRARLRSSRGGGSGAGLGQAKIFAAACRVVIADIRQDHLDEAVEALKRVRAQVHGVKLDVADRAAFARAAFARAADETERVFGPVALLFNRAGVSLFGAWERASYDDYDGMMGVNFGGVVNGMQTFVPRMIAHGRGGHIVNTASLGAFHAASVAGIYSASKFAVHGQHAGKARRAGQINIGVSCLVSGKY
jgi:NADP-dependent 3-hydroxy acid dehydrogenase YdfG